MRILDRYILTQFFKNFFGALFILILIFIFHTIWLFIDELAGRGLELWIIGKFILYYIPQLIPIILPLTVVLSSIMTFGAFAENYEFAAMKASGVSLLRAMRPLILFMLFLSGFTFFLANNVIPVAHAEVSNLRRNIARVKPAMAIAEGVFSDIGDELSIRVAKKSGKNDEFLEDVIIHKKSPDKVNRTVINAQRGELKNDKDTDFLQLILYDGTYYEDIYTTNYRQQQKYPFAKVKFDRYVMNMDLSHLNKVDFNEKSGINTYKMMTVGQLSYTVDSLKTYFKDNLTDYGNSQYRRTGVLGLDFAAKPDLPLDDENIKPDDQNKVEKNQEITPKLTLDSIFAKIDPSRKLQVYETALMQHKNFVESTTYKTDDINYHNKMINLHLLTLSDKYALTMACLVLFFVAAPLGAFIRKGGIGLPLVASMVLFLSYYFIGLFSKNVSENGTINPLFAPWIPTLILLPLGIYLTTRVTTDKGLFQFERIKDFFQQITQKKQRKKSASR